MDLNRLLNLKSQRIKVQLIKKVEIKVQMKPVHLILEISVPRLKGILHIGFLTSTNLKQIKSLTQILMLAKNDQVVIFIILINLFISSKN